MSIKIHAKSRSSLRSSAPVCLLDRQVLVKKDLQQSFSLQAFQQISEVLHYLHLVLSINGKAILLQSGIHWRGPFITRNFNLLMQSSANSVLLYSQPPFLVVYFIFKKNIFNIKLILKKLKSQKNKQSNFMEGKERREGQCNYLQLNNTLMSLFYVSTPIFFFL